MEPRTDARLGGCLAPGYFLSYSRRQRGFAEELAASLAGVSRSVWFDRDEIGLGDRWMKTIEAGVAAADEFVLLVTDDSLASEVVGREIELAVRGGKLIRPILLEPVSRPLPAAVGERHYIDITASPPAERCARIVALLGGEVAESEAIALKSRAARALWPPFERAFASGDGRARAAGYAAALDALTPGYPPGSAIWLNAGLMRCAALDWDRGLDLLRRHAAAANHLAGWHFLALHLCRGQPVHRAAVGVVREALTAARAARALGRNPLNLMTLAVLEAGGENAGPAHVGGRLKEFVEAARAVAEPASEYLRFYWAMQASLPALAGYEASARAIVKEFAI
jgi:hypothetical protein